MTTINLRKFFYWYKVDEYIEVSDEVAAELMADKRFEFNCWRQAKRNKANYSLDAEDGILRVRAVPGGVPGPRRDHPAAVLRPQPSATVPGAADRRSLPAGPFR